MQSTVKAFTDFLTVALSDSIRSLFRNIDTTLTMLSGITAHQKNIVKSSEEQLKLLEAIVAKMPVGRAGNDVAVEIIDELESKLNAAIGEAAWYKRHLESLIDTNAAFIEAFRSVKCSPRIGDRVFHKYNVLEQQTKGIAALKLARDLEPVAYTANGATGGNCNACGGIHFPGLCPEKLPGDDGECDTCGTNHFAGECLGPR